MDKIKGINKKEMRNEMGNKKKYDKVINRDNILVMS